MSQPAPPEPPPYETPEAGVLWGLYYALYRSPAEFMTTLPTPVVKAYMAVQQLVRSKPEGSES